MVKVGAQVSNMSWACDEWKWTKRLPPNLATLNRSYLKFSSEQSRRYQAASLVKGGQCTFVISGSYKGRHRMTEHLEDSKRSKLDRPKVGVSVVSIRKFALTKGLGHLWVKFLIGMGHHGGHGGFFSLKSANCIGDVVGTFTLHPSNSALSVVFRRLFR